MDRDQQANYALNYCRACNWNVYYRPGAMGATTKQEGNLDDCERAHCDIMVWTENNFNLEFSGIVQVVLQTRGALAHTMIIASLHPSSVIQPLSP